ncbi:LpxA family transferase [Pseudomonas entomophila]|uniref:LpxA family transferase n=1 Tax=Pseudomonas entomophila TaxID=312306 RepID=UPI0023D8C28B|nr:LpxA family transferase [Pseudomonas entomophila]MDF0730089.1 LpxA family transferase [Pseudomonas entomophila]
MISIAAFIPAFAASPFADATTPWHLVANLEALVDAQIDHLPTDQYRLDGRVAVHRDAAVEPGAVLKGPLIIGPGCFIATGAYLRGGCWLERDCILGPGAELKTSLMFAGSKLAHFNFVGDSIIGRDVNLEAGSIVCNYRNERTDKEIQVRLQGTLHKTGVQKFGALLGDHTRLGANAVVAPGGLLPMGSIVRRASLLDQESA